MRSLAARWLGVGLAAITAVVTIWLWATGDIGLYINPDSAWFAVLMSVFALIGAIATFALPLGAEDEHDHGHDHGGPVTTRADDHIHGDAVTLTIDHGLRHRTSRTAALAVTVTGGVVATGITVAMLVLPPASLSAELAMARDVGAPPLFAGADDLALATGADTSDYGISEWAATFATATSPDSYAGDDVQLTGFVTPDPDDPDAFLLTRLVITHCVIDAQPATVPVQDAGWDADLEIGDWVSVDGEIVSDAAGMAIAAGTVTAVDEPGDPYEY